MTAPAPLLDRPVAAAAPLRPHRRRHPVLLLVGAVAVLAVLAALVAGLPTSGSSGTATSAGSATAVAPTAGVAAAPEGSAGQQAAGKQAPGTDAVAAPAGTPATVIADKVVKTGQLELVAGNGRVPATLTAVQQAAVAAGAAVAGSSTQEFGSAPSGVLTLRVPVAGFDALLLRLRGLGAQVHAASTSATDVTGQSVDLDAQARTLRDTRDQLLDIKRKATDVTDILTVQQRIDDITARINQTEGQAAVLRDQAAMSTLTVTVRQAGDPGFGPVQPARGGLGQAFRDARTSFGNGVEAIVRHSGTVLLLALCLLALALPALYARRVVRRRTEPLPAPVPAE